MTRRLPLLLAGAVFLLLLFKPASMSLLRAREAASTPASWQEGPSGGRFAVLLPRLFATRWHDEALYAARAAMVLRHGLPYDPYWREDRGLKDWIQGFPVFFAMAGFSLAAGSDMDRGWLLAAAVLGACWFLLFYEVLLGWSGKETAAAPLALFSVLYPDLYGWLFDINFGLRANWERYASVFIQQGAEVRPHFYRLPAGMLTFLLLCLLFVASWKLLMQERVRPAASALLGVGFGLLFFVHAYTHAFGLATLGTLAAAAWLLRPSAGARANMLTAFFAAVLVSIGSAALMSRLIDPLTRADCLQIVGLEHTHRFYKITLIHLLLGGLGLLAARRETEAPRKAAWLVLACAQAGIFACRNAQVVFGFTVQPHHYIPMGSFMGAMMLLLPLSRRLGRASWWDRRKAITASVLVCLGFLANETVAAARGYSLFGLPADLESGLSWVRAHADKDALVLSLSMQTNEALALRTQASVQAAPVSPPIASPFSKERYYSKVAALLRTLDANEDLFLEQRFLLPRVKLRVVNDIVADIHAGRVPAREAFEEAEWFHPLLWGVMDDAPFLEGRERIRVLARGVAPLEPPYYVWLDDPDIRFLRRPLQSLGGRQVFRSGAVSIYEFARMRTEKR